MLFFVLCLVSILAVGLYQFRFFKRERRLSSVTWDELLAQMQCVDVPRLREVADCYLNPTKNQLRIQPAEMWEIVGVLTGITKLTANAEVMLDLARYAERWNDANGRVLSEIIRRDAVRVQHAVRQIEMAMLTNRGLVYLGMELQEAVSSYCLMRARLLGAYAECHVGLLPRLEAAV